jgi:hypothetical protein
LNAQIALGSQPPNSAKAAISIINMVLTTAIVRYSSLGEDGSTFIGLPRFVAERIMLPRITANGIEE